MPQEVPFRLKMTGDTADQHYFQGYEGYLALAGFAWTLSLVSNYVETGKIRQKRDFPGRHAVRATAIERGSILSVFNVWLQNNPAEALALGIPASMVAGFLCDLVKHVINRNIGIDDTPKNESVQQVISKRDGDIEALVAINESPIRQTHGVIGNGATVINIYGDGNAINTYNFDTKNYVMQNVEDRSVHEKSVSVAAFNANSGYGSVFDFDLGRTVPISIARDVVRQFGSVFTWGINEYANRTGKNIKIRFWRILAMDGTPKKYIILDAAIQDE